MLYYYYPLYRQIPIDWHRFVSKIHNKSKQMQHRFECQFCSYQISIRKKDWPLKFLEKKYVIILLHFKFHGESLGLSSPKTELWRDHTVILPYWSLKESALLSFYFCLPALLGIHRNPMRKYFLESSEGILESHINRAQPSQPSLKNCPNDTF